MMHSDTQSQSEQVGKHPTKDNSCTSTYSQLSELAIADEPHVAAFGTSRLSLASSQGLRGKLCFAARALM